MSPKTIRKYLQLLKPFMAIDKRIQVCTVATLLEVALAEAKGETVSTKDIGKRVGLQSGTSTRNVYCWTKDGGLYDSGREDFIEIEMAKEDRRFRNLSLTPKGRHFVEALLALLDDDEED